MTRPVRIAFCDFWDDFKGSETFLPLIERNSDPLLLEVSPDDKPDVLMFSVFGRRNERFTDPQIRRVFFTGENYSRSLFPSDFALSFDLDVESDRHMRFPLWLYYTADLNIALLQDHLRHWKIPSTQPPLKERVHLCSWISSAYNPTRNDIVQNFMRHVGPVACAGKQLNNVGGPVDDKHGFLQTSKFDFALENTSRAGYCTEKLLQAFAAGCIPIYWGDPEVTRDFNEKAFIRVTDFESWSDLWDYLRTLSNAPERLHEIRQEPIFTDPCRHRLTRGRAAWESRVVEGILGPQYSTWRRSA